MHANSWHHPSKGKALWLGIVYGMVAIVLFWIGSSSSVGICGFTGTTALIVSAIYFLVFLSKVSRDGERVRQAEQVRYIAAEHYEAPAPKTTSGNRFFVPGQSSDRSES